MLPADQSQRNQALEAIRRTVEASGKLSGERAKRLAEIEKLFAAGEANVATTPKAPAKSKTPAKPKAAAEPKAPAKRAPRKAV
jgi:hypothetical protein